ncbi:plastid/chloroplast ribosomal protein L7/L12 [Volvox carteri f. nagariensis]|uniref:Plastid/chloroplast ribosomal protein L7/L12 n=1 Tax=Volvox carteri f. nagariensis TaxID=3068 RepID=D8TQZ8_VOLCA|nr:plastid/chloroplast ribosomal protein L7/L12 [Volvox carteri f. nagariensis]EFJ50248.1 plastid/chloroplast ribosomal protein L7/L12 [Volvox carteri f. nagariensis]|eukprot:XP_002948868.1 plastid/chloroplast ribosomal protein L7/L12 [Volvox carteri f. nagariensis]
MALCMQTRSIAGVRPRTSAVRSVPFRGSRMVVRASPAVSEIVDKLKTLTLLEASELVSEIEKTFGVDASAAAPVAVAAMPAAAAAAPVVEEKTTFDVVLEDIPADKKVGIYKVVRNIANIAVNQVKEFTATLPKVLKEGLSKEDAEAAKTQLLEAGAKAKVV